MTKFIPAPGAYATTADFRKSAPKFGFGTSKRPEMGKTKLNTPGPGSYKLNSKIGNVADFNMPGRTAESKYVWEFKKQ